MLDEAILDALITKIETQTRLEWQSVTLVNSLGNETRLYKIVVLKHKLLDIFLYSTVEYTIGYMYRVSLSELTSAL